MAKGHGTRKAPNSASGKCARILSEFGEQQKPGGLSCKLLQNQANRQRFSHKAKRPQRKAQCFRVDF
jgi:hypothetical protein